MKKFQENKERLEKLYEDPCGLWNVAQEAEYGRGAYHIGDYFGHFADIALHVKATKDISRPLVFTKLDTEQMTVPTDATGEVVVIMGYDSPFFQNNISSVDTCKEYEESCKAKDVTLRTSGGPGSMLVKRESEQSKLRASAMAKILTALSPEELAAMFPEEAKKIAAAVATTESEE